MPMNSLIEIRTAPSGKVYIMWFDHPICDPAGGLLYFDDNKEALRFMQDRGAEELRDAIAS